MTAGETIPFLYHISDGQEGENWTEHHLWTVQSTQKTVHDANDRVVVHVHSFWIDSRDLANEFVFILVWKILLQL